MTAIAGPCAVLHLACNLLWRPLSQSHMSRSTVEISTPVSESRHSPPALLVGAGRIGAALGKSRWSVMRLLRRGALPAARLGAGAKSPWVLSPLAVSLLTVALLRRRTAGKASRIKGLAPLAPGMPLACLAPRRGGDVLPPRPSAPRTSRYKNRSGKGPNASSSRLESGPYGGTGWLAALMFHDVECGSAPAGDTNAAPNVGSYEEVPTSTCTAL